MRYRYEEYAPSNKKQYVIACGIHELRALLDAARSAKGFTPTRTKEQKAYRSALAGTIKGLGEAIRYAESQGDTGNRRGVYLGVEKETIKGNLDEK